MTTVEKWQRSDKKYDTYDIPLVQRKKKINYKNRENALKARYTHPTNGRIIAGAGILLYEERPEGKGVWLGEEKYIPESRYNDFGGKYEHGDADPCFTVIRELQEETYHSIEHVPSYKFIKSLPENNFIYVGDDKPCYMCVVLNIKSTNIIFDDEELKTNRLNILNTNSTPATWYKTCGVQFVLLKDISEGKYKLDSRILAVLQKLSNEATDVGKFFQDYDYNDLSA